MAKKKKPTKKRLNKKELARIEELNLKQLLKLSGEKRVRVKGKFVPRKVEGDLIEFAAREKMPLEQFIDKNIRDIEFFINEDAVVRSYRTDSLISLLKDHKGKITVKGYDYKGNPQLFRDLQEFKKHLVNRKGVSVADFFFDVKLKTKSKEIIIDLSDLKKVKKTKSSKLEDAEFTNITLIISPNK